MMNSKGPVQVEQPEVSLCIWFFIAHMTFILLLMFGVSNNIMQYMLNSLG